MNPRKRSSSFSNLVATLRNIFMRWKRFSTRWRAKYLAKSNGRASLRLLLDGIIASMPPASASSTTALESYPLSARSAFADKPSTNFGASPTSEKITRSQFEAKRIAQRVANGVNFGVQSATRDANRLGPSFFCAPEEA